MLRGGGGWWWLVAATFILAPVAAGSNIEAARAHQKLTGGASTRPQPHQQPQQPQEPQQTQEPRPQPAEFLAEEETAPDDQLRALVEEAAGLTPYDYLRRFGYLPAASGATDTHELSAGETARAIATFQRFMNLSPTSSQSIDQDTIQRMEQPRCANKDLEEVTVSSQEEATTAASTDDERERDDATGQARLRADARRWPLTPEGQLELTYKLLNYPSHLLKRRHEVDQLFHTAFSSWSTLVPEVSFAKRQPQERAHLAISFVRDDHPGCPLGPLPKPTPSSTLLGHAHPPPSASSSALYDTLAGDIHLNDHVPWQLEASAPADRNLHAAIVHQIGHSLGLGHSHLLASRLFPLARNRTSLGNVDRLALRRLYGPRLVPRDWFGFVELDRRRPPPRRQQPDAGWPNVGSADECARHAFGGRRHAQLAVWDRQRRQCSAISSSNKTSQQQQHQQVALFSSAGLWVSGGLDKTRVDATSFEGPELDASELEPDVAQWLELQLCDLILKEADWPEQGRNLYRCRLYQEDECCVMLVPFSNRSLESRPPDLVSAKLLANSTQFENKEL